MKDKIELAADLNDLMDTVSTEAVRQDLVFSLLIKAWDIGYIQGCHDIREAQRDWANAH